MVTKNQCLMKIRDRQGKQPAELKEQMIAGIEEDSSKAVYIEKDRQLELMAESLEELNKEQKQCVTLFYLDKRSYQQIADDTGFSLTQVKSYIQNGKRNLKLLLEKKLKERAR
jgi:RNA polymerase sigma-70 factor (ECF subfamily)